MADARSRPVCPHAGKTRVVLCGSPRTNGRSAKIATALARDLAAEYPEDCLILLEIAGATVHGCIGCDACRAAGECVFEDDMASIREALDAADELHLVSPVYFAGPPSQLKAVLDRFQPHYWMGTRTRFKSKRPAFLHVVGEGGDPHGFGPLVTICRSAMSVAGFSLESTTPHIGKGAL